MLDLYWNLGKDIVDRQEHAKWGDSFLTVMSRDLKKAFPGVAGFSVQNLRNMRYWYKFYNDSANCLQVVSEFAIVERMIKNIPWGHNQRIMYKCKDINEALFYVQKTMDNNWSRNVLEHQIDSDLYERKGKAITNFKVKLPVPQSDLALDDVSQPIGIAQYELTKVLREEFKSSLPTIEEIENELMHRKKNCSDMQNFKI